MLSGKIIYFDFASPIMIPTMDEFDFGNKSVILRVDINSPLDPSTLEIMDNWRIRRCIPTIEELVEKNAKVIILAHQGRPGKWDFTSLEKHAKELSRLMNRDVKFVDDVYGSKAIEEIEEASNGEVILLDNVRKCEEEMKKLPPEEHARAEMVKKLSGHASAFINDAFAAAHRSHCSMVGFIPVLPSFAGRLMEAELKNLDKMMKSAERPRIFIFGGGKYENSIEVIKNLLEKGIADKILLGGMPANAFLGAMKKIDFDANGEIKEIMEKYGGKVILPVDMVYEDGELDVEEARKPGKDIGSKTIDIFKEEIKNAASILISGPMGVFEEERFARGTKEILEAIAGSEAFSIAGGGHTVAAINKLRLAEKFSYVSTGGGSLERFLMGRSLPVVEALIKFKRG